MNLNQAFDINLVPDGLISLENMTEELKLIDIVKEAFNIDNQTAKGILEDIKQTLGKNSSEKISNADIISAVNELKEFSNRK